MVRGVVCRPDGGGRRSDRVVTVRLPDDDVVVTRASDRSAWLRPGAHVVVPGIVRIPLPLPLDGLRAVNVYALIDGDGAVLVDAGWAVDESRAALVAALRDLGLELTDVGGFL